MNALNQIAKEREPQKIYLMRNDFGLYKVGISHDPESRRAQIENSSGVPTKIVEIFEATDAYQVEQKIHGALKDIRRTGEWFAFADDSEALEQVRRVIFHMPSTEVTQPDPVQVSTRYRMGIQDVKDALSSEGIVIHTRVLKGANQMVVVAEGEAHYGQAATTLALAFAHSGLVKAGFFKPDLQILKKYLEAISYLTPAPELSQPPFESELVSQIAQAARTGVFDGIKDPKVSDVLTAIGFPRPARSLQLEGRRALSDLGWRRRILRGRTVYHCPNTKNHGGETGGATDHPGEQEKHHA